MVAVVTLGNSMIANHVLSFMVYSWLIKLFVSQFLVLSTFFACLSDVDLFFFIILLCYSPGIIFSHQRMVKMYHYI